MSEDDSRNSATPAVPESSRRWSEEDRRTLIITIGGGLAANLATVIIVGAAIAFARHGKLSATEEVYNVLILGGFAIVTLVWGILLKRGRRFWVGTTVAAWLMIGVGSFLALEVLLILTGLAAGVK